MLKGVTQREFDAEHAAMRLVKRLNGAVGGMLSDNPEITASALKILDPTPPPQLMRAWRKERSFDFDDEEYRAELQTQTDDL
jgi:hypothetical protein